MNGVSVYGGFAGTESSLSQRDIYNNETILSGDIYGDDGLDFANNNENCLHVFFHPDGTNLNATAVLDGFTITAGNSNSGASIYSSGGGMANYGSSPTVANCTFEGNAASLIGGGMYNRYDSAPTVTRCTFSGNKAGYHGGGMGNSDLSAPTVSDCTFSDNIAESYYGGGMFNTRSSPIVTNCTFSGNSAGYYGGGMANLVASMTPSNPTVTNCIFYGNSAALSNHEIYNSGSTPFVAYSNIAGCLNGTSWNPSMGTNGGGNMDENPRFDNYLQLQSGSPCIDAADGDVASSTDLLGNTRYDDPAMSNIGVGNPRYVDMGACEYQGGVTTPQSYTLSVYSSGATSVPISSSTGHSGTTTYTKTVNSGTTVTLTAPVLSGKDFTGWTGSVNSSSRSVSLSMTSNKSVTANYQAATAS
ncbi:MAG: InlB B-repeat-containing protein, partial [Planctomycetota bacterium]